MSESAQRKYLRRLIAKASSDTWHLVVELPIWTFIFGLAIAAVAIYLQRRFGSMSRDQMKDAFTSLGFGLGAIAITYFFVFLFHLFYLTPKHLYAEAHARAEETQAQLDQLNVRRPDFFYQGIGSEIKHSFRMNPATNKPIVKIEFLLRFQNSGATAYNISSKIYACWVNDDPPGAGLADSTEPTVGRTRENECKLLGFMTKRNARELGNSQIGLNATDVLLILVEIRSRLGSNANSPVLDNEPVWKTWDPRIPNRLCDAAESDVRVAREQIDRLKATATPPS